MYNAEGKTSWINEYFPVHSLNVKRANLTIDPLTY